jgi:hypothetical protein
VLAGLARSRLRGKLVELEEAFTGYFTDHHARLLTKMLARIDGLSADIAELDAMIEEMVAPYLWRDPRSTGSVFGVSSVGLGRGRSAAAVKVERPWTNDLDRGEDRPMLLGAEKDEGTSQVNGGSRSGAIAGGCRDRGGVRGRPALSRCTEWSVSVLLRRHDDRWGIPQEGCGRSVF